MRIWDQVAPESDSPNSLFTIDIEGVSVEALLLFSNSPECSASSSAWPAEGGGCFAAAAAGSANGVSVDCAGAAVLACAQLAYQSHAQAIDNSALFLADTRKFTCLQESAEDLL